MSRIIVWFSCGAASACAAKLASGQYSEELHVVYCDTSKSEHPDNARFMLEVGRWIGRDITIIRSSDYADVDDVFEKTRYMSGIKGARCTVEMKKIPRFKFQQPDDVHIFGLTADEHKRRRDFEMNNPELHLEWPLFVADLTKPRCLQMLELAGIQIPEMYRLGFKNNNCIGCVKATSPKYWNRVRRLFPDIFGRRCRQSRELGVRLVRVGGERIFLDELPEVIREDIPEVPVTCGPECAHDGPVRDTI